MLFKEKLVILRKSRRLTQDEFASAVGVSRQAVYKWESGQSYPEVPKLIEMKLLLGISIDDLLDDSYDIPLPEKKRRRGKISDADKAAIEASVESGAVAAAAAPVAAKVEEPKAEPVKVEAPKAEPKKVEKKPEPAKVEEPKAEEPKVEENKAQDSLDAAASAVERLEKKMTFFNRLFGNKK